MANITSLKVLCKLPTGKDPSPSDLSKRTFLPEQALSLDTTFLIQLSALALEHT